MHLIMAALDDELFVSLLLNARSVYTRHRGYDVSGKIKALEGENDIPVG